MTTNGVVPNGVVPNGVVPNGVVPNGVVPNGVVPNGVVPNGVVPNGVVPNGVNGLNGHSGHAAPEAPAPPVTARPVPPVPDYPFASQGPALWFPTPVIVPPRAVPDPPTPAPPRAPAGVVVEADRDEDEDDFDGGPKDWVRRPSSAVGSAASSAKWAFAGLGIRSAVSGVSSFALARFVGPQTYGVMGLGITYVAISTLLVDQGMGQALIRMKNIRRSDVATMQVTTITIAIVAGGLTALSGRFWQGFFHAPGLGALLVALGLGLVLKSVAMPGQAVLQRDGQFRWLAGCDIVSSIASAAAGLGVAAMTGSALALAAQILVNDALYSFGIGLKSGAPLRGANRPALRGMLGFTLKVSGSQWLGFAGRNADNVLIGRVLGQQPLAYYLVSYRFMMLPIQNLTMVANRVLYPTYARIQDDIPRFRNAFLKTCALMSIVATPLMACLFVFAEPLTVGLLGNAWRPAVIPTQVLALVAIVQVQTSLITPPIVAFGRASWQLIWSAVYTALTIGLFAVTVHWGVNAVCYGYLAANLITLPGPIRLVGRLGGFRLWDFFRSVSPGLGFGVLVGCIGTGLRGIMQGGLDMPDVATAIIGGGLSLALGAGALLVLSPNTLKQLRQLR